MILISSFRKVCIDAYLKNQNKDETYSLTIQTAGYWLYQADHAPLEEFDGMVSENGLVNDYYHQQVRLIIIKALNE